MRNKKGVIPLIPILIFVGLFLITVYVLLYLPIPAFKTIRYSVEYFLLVLLWFILEVAIIYIYFKIIMFSRRGLEMYKRLIKNIGGRIDRYIVVHA
jgi:hypothetical protein